MALFGKREVVFKTAGDKVRWKAACAALKAAGVRVTAAGSRESEASICSRSGRTYYVAVRPEDVGRAYVVLVTAVGVPLISDELVVPQKKAQGCTV